MAVRGAGKREDQKGIAPALSLPKSFHSYRGEGLTVGNETFRTRTEARRLCAWVASFEGKVDACI